MVFFQYRLILRIGQSDISKGIDTQTLLLNPTFRSSFNILDQEKAKSGGGQRKKSLKIEIKQYRNKKDKQAKVFEL